MNSEEAVASMKAVLSVALAIGNYMNGGTNRGQAYGVRLDILVLPINTNTRTCICNLFASAKTG